MNTLPFQQLPYRQLPDHYYSVSATPSPYYHRHCAGCSDPAEQTGVDFTTLDPDRRLCRGCANE